MTIKLKLTLNVIIVIVIVAAVAVTSIIGMGFIKRKLTYLTERSTPFQIRTVEFQRSTQAAIADLIKLNASRSRTEYGNYRQEAEKSIAGVKAGQEALAAIATDKQFSTYDDLSRIAGELFETTDQRLKSEEEAQKANQTITIRMNEAVGRLHQLDNRIKGLQRSSTATYGKSTEAMKDVSLRVGNIEQLRLVLKDFQIGFMELGKAQSRKGILIAQGKCNSSLAKAGQNQALKESKQIGSDIAFLNGKTPEFSKLQMDTLAAPPTNVAARDALQSEMMERLNSLALAVEQEMSMARDRVTTESGHQGESFNRSNSATAILSVNAELVALGLSVNGLVTRLFTVNSPKELGGIQEQIGQLFHRIDDARGRLAGQLGTLKARQEAAMLQGAASSLGSIREMLAAKDGIIARLRFKLEMQEKAVQATAKLREIVIKQAEAGQKTVTVAQGDQEKAIASVNQVVRFSTMLISAIGIGAVLFGILFGLWVYRSIAKPLNQLLKVSDEVANGDLATEISANTADEVGKVQSSMAVMVKNLREMVGKIKRATDSLASSSEELSTTATALERGAEEQNSRIEQSATAMTQMSQTTIEVARNSTDTSEAAEKMKTIAGQGKEAMHLTVQELKKFADTVKGAAVNIEALGQQSEEINNVVTLIEGIADQTNLLALNAAIEAARAGDQGRGFAVVADEVRGLAERTTTATKEIADMVNRMQGGVAESVSFMKDERESVEKVLEQVNHTLAAIDEIVNYVGNVTDRVQRIAVAAEQQSSSTDEVSRNMDDIALITRELKNSFNDIKNSSGNLSELATELNSMVGWFRV